MKRDCAIGVVEETFLDSAPKRHHPPTLFQVFQKDHGNSWTTVRVAASQLQQTDRQTE